MARNRREPTSQPDSRGLDVHISGARSAQDYSRANSQYYRESSQSYRGGAQDRVDEPNPADQFSRRSTQAEYSKKRKRGSRMRKVLIGVASTFALALVAVGVASAAYLWQVNSNLHSSADPNASSALTEKASAQDPFYMLLIGIDRSEYREETNEYDGAYRSDTLILTRVDPKNKKVTLVSIYRDTYVNIEGHGPGKINAAYAFGGAQLAISTVSKFAGVPISHYAIVDFDGLEAVVDSVGGIDVNVPRDIDDDQAGGSLSAGQQTLDGEQALILCRSRHSYDDVGDGDAYRAANQRMVIGAIADKVLQSDPSTILSTISTLSQYIETDMSATDIAGLAVNMKGIDVETDIYSAMNPTTSAYEGGVWYEYSNQDAWAAMMKRVDQGLSPLPNEADTTNDGGVTDGTLNSEYVIQQLMSEADSSSASSGASISGATVTVLNGNGVDGAAARASSMLTPSGAKVVSTGSASSFDHGTTLVVYGESGNEQVAQAIVKRLGVGTAMRDDGSFGSFSSSYLVIVGSDFND